EVKAGADRPALTNLLTIFSLVSGKTVKELEAAYDGKGYGAFKADLAGAVNAWLDPIQDTITYLLEDERVLTGFLRDGAAKARARAEAKMQDVRHKIGVAL